MFKTINQSLEKHQFLTANAIKLLACALMFLDHIHEFFHIYGAPVWLKIPGRMVFPLFLFLAADSFHFTRNRRKYMTRLYLGMVTMVVGTFLVSSILPNPDLVIANNAFSTFFVTGIYIIAYDYFKESVLTRKVSSFFKGLGLALLPVLAVIPTMLVMSEDMLTWMSNQPDLVGKVIMTSTMLIPNILLVEGGYMFVILGLAFYIVRENRALQILALVALSVYLYFDSPTGVSYWMILAAIPMALYNGQKGGGSRSFFYIFYPVHIYGLYILSTLVGPMLFK